MEQQELGKAELAKYLNDCKVESMNEVIAIFDGRKKRTFDDQEWWSDVGDYDPYVWKTGELQYHSDWGWLMPVAKKCKERLQEMPVESITSEAGYMYTIYEMLKTFNPALVHKAVFNFIERYNKRTK